MKNNPHTQISKQLVALASILGVGAFVGAPAIAQQYPNSSQDDVETPAQMQQMPMQETEMQQMEMNQSDSAAMNIVEVASGNSSFNTLTQALQAAGLTDTLAAQGPYTVFAPTDEAFNQLPEGTLQFLLQPENRDLLRQVLTYHVIQGEVTASEITSGPVEALGGGLAVRVTDDGNVIVNNASVVQPNIQASNGVIHTVNRVLLPENLQRTLASQLGVQEIY
ncbi:MAG: hypothetical protein Kow00121_41860 [Elainellaceae cyanobacterium]